MGLGARRPSSAPGPMASLRSHRYPGPRKASSTARRTGRPRYAPSSRATIAPRPDRARPSMSTVRSLRAITGAAV